MDKDLFQDDIRPTYNKTRDLDKGEQAKSAYRDAKGVSQAVVKVSSYSKGRGRLTAHLEYISRNSKLELEDPTGNTLRSKEEVKEVLDHWYSDADMRKNARMSANIVLSAPEGSDREGVKRAAREFARKTFSDNHDYLFAIHNDTDHPHAHLVVKLRGYDGEKLRLGKKELHQLRQGFAQSLMEQGIEATASYRSDRGVGRKSQKQRLKHMKDRGIVPDVEKQAVKQAAKEMKGNDSQQKPWEVAIKVKNDQVREDYKHLGAELETSDDPNTIEVGKTISKYAKDLPKPVTREQAIKAEIQRRLEKQRSQRLAQDAER